ncbi:replication protein [Listeria monocytogenes]|nr:replication protein [Listeria monocytogenes]EFN3147715.1 protein rep [Listeria monocytogenes]MCA9766892.1 protein rep [Carnobacterium sp.]HAG7163974.1 protein rep [Listeria monocytogenes]HAK3661081.1 protein rep [Listeria monocytogenes]
MGKNQDIILDKYQPKKKQSLKTAEFMKSKLSEKGYELFKDCSTFNQFITTFDKENKKMVASNSCKNRFCPICTYRKARKDALMLLVIMTALQQEKKQEFLFLTLTTPNVKADELTSEINRFNKAFSKLFRRKKVQKSIKGYVRKLEITYDKHELVTHEMYKKRKGYYDRRGLTVGSINPNFDTYNPHFHVILSVPRHYFTVKDYYIPQQEWLDMWRDVTGLDGINEDGTDEITSLHIKKVKGVNQSNAISEVAKYSAKDYEMLESSDVFDVFYKAMKGRQLITFNGFFKEYKKKFDNGELDKYIDKDMNEYVWKLLALWNPEYKKYEQVYDLMTEEEKLEFNNHKKTDIEVED